MVRYFQNIAKPLLRNSINICILGNITHFNIASPVTQEIQSVNMPFHGIRVVLDPAFQACANFAKNGDLEGLKNARQNGCAWDATTCTEAAAGGHLHVLSYAFENSCPKNDLSLTVSAVRFGDMDVLKFVNTNNIRFELKAFVVAAELGNLEVLKFVMGRRYTGSFKSKSIMDELATIFSAAAIAGHTSCLEFGLSTFDFRFSNDTVIRTASGGHIDCLKAMESYGFDEAFDDESVCEAAANNGHLDCLKYLHSNGYPWDSSTCNAAASKGHLACLEYACNQGCPRNDYTCTAAAKGGHMECLKFLKEKSCFWNTATCEAASAGGHTSVLKWLIENGCPCPSTAGVHEDDKTIETQKPAKKMKTLEDILGSATFQKVVKK